jgi:hypothetical protein
MIDRFLQCRRIPSFSESGFVEPVDSCEAASWRRVVSSVCVSSGPGNAGKSAARTELSSCAQPSRSSLFSSVAANHRSSLRIGGRFVDF